MKDKKTTNSIGKMITYSTLIFAGMVCITDAIRSLVMDVYYENLEKRGLVIVPRDQIIQ